ncbi:MAG: toprim domain-containing protein [Parvibaculum sp.]|nr:toprim domain-containing protein [Parvibaculum sp.]
MSSASDLARGLGQNAEAVCRTYLPKGRRQGRYWICGDVHGTPGRSLYVQLFGERAGKWTDASEGTHGDLLDLIMANRGLDFRAACDEARAFLRMPIVPAKRMEVSAPAGSSEAARRLFAASKSIRGTLADVYLRSRGIMLPPDISALRFHPRCYYRAPEGRQTWPALIAAVTDGAGNVTGVHRTWLDLASGKAPVDQPRRALGHLAGNGVRFGTVTDTMLAAEGLETALALKMIMPAMPVIAALSAAHLAALNLPSTLRRLYVARDNDQAGRIALEKLRTRAVDLDIRELVPRAEDFNADLLTLGPDRLRGWIGEQLAPDDSQFLIHDGRQCA